MSVSVRVYMLDESRESHHVLQSHPVHHLDVVVSDQLGGGDWREAAVVYLSSHAGVKDLGWGETEVRDSEGRHTAPTCCPVQLLHLLGVRSLQELVKVVLGRGLVLIAPRYDLMMNFLLKFFQIPFTSNGIE